MKPKLPLDVHAFEIMRNEYYVYVDKTRHIAQMLREGRFYFLSRPRRFGKTLLVSTLKCLFQGRKELFEGLWIAEQSNWDWQTYPVILLDFNQIPGNSPDELRSGLLYQLQQVAASYEVQVSSTYVELGFQELIQRLFQKFAQPVVVLIDEYDKRIIDHLGKGERELGNARGNRDVLKSFFGVLKGGAIGTMLRFVFLTGISRFSKVSIFSELNNLLDLSMLDTYADVLGYTQEEIQHCFQAELTDLAAAWQLSQEQVLARLAEYYNGYRFTERNVRVYNPFSFLRACWQQKIQGFWFESATPTFLINVLKERRYNVPKLEGLQVSQTVFTTFDLDRLQPEALLFQTGYLTIRDVQRGIYTLDYPNQEVKTAFTEALVLAIAPDADIEISSHILRLREELEQVDLDAFFTTMRAIFASIPYDIQAKRDEAYFHTMFYLVMAASGVTVHSSVLICDGRIDLLVELPAAIYIIEFKCNQSAQAAIQQIYAQRYADPYRSRGKPIRLLGINFSTDARNITEWTVVDE